MLYCSFTTARLSQSDFFKQSSDIIVAVQAVGRNLPECDEWMRALQTQSWALKFLGNNPSCVLVYLCAFVSADLYFSLLHQECVFFSRTYVMQMGAYDSSVSFLPSNFLLEEKATHFPLTQKKRVTAESREVVKYLEVFFWEPVSCPIMLLSWFLAVFLWKSIFQGVCWENSQLSLEINLSQLPSVLSNLYYFKLSLFIFL